MYVGAYYLTNMKLDFLEDMTEGGKYKQVVSENLVRLYDFTPEETTRLIALIQKVVIEEQQELDLGNIEFITPVNCQLVLKVSDDETGITRQDSNVFVCHLPVASYQEMLPMMEAASEGHNWLYEQWISDIDFLYSPGGTW